MAAIVLALGITTAITTLQHGMRAIDTARNMTLAAQIMQSDIEILRLQNWSQMLALPSPATVDPTATISSGNTTSLDVTLNTIAQRFLCTRTIEDVPGRADIKRIRHVASWTGVDGRRHSLIYEIRYAKNGLSDYYYVSH